MVGKDRITMLNSNAGNTDDVSGPCTFVVVMDIGARCEFRCEMLLIASTEMHRVKYRAMKHGNVKLPAGSHDYGTT